MSTPVVAAAWQLQAAGVVATSAVGPAKQVRTTFGPWVGLVDHLTFPGGTGRLSFGSTRVRLHGVPALPSNASGLATLGGSSATVLVAQGHPRIRIR